MGYYDSVKDSVGGDGQENDASYDTLKEQADDNQNEEDEGDDTPIEVLEEGLENRSSGSSGGEASGSGFPPASSSEGDLDSVEEKLDELVELNREILKTLRSFSS